METIYIIGAVVTLMFFLLGLIFRRSILWWLFIGILYFILGIPIMGGIIKGLAGV